MASMEKKDGRTRPLLIRFLEKIRVSETEWHAGSPCWLWTGGGCESHRLRAGKIYLDGSRRKQDVHIVAYLEFVEPISDGCGVERDCGNWQCCSPLHLSLSNRKRGRIKQSKKSSALGRALKSIRVEGDCWIVPHRTGNKNKNRISPKPLLVKYLLGEVNKNAMRHRLCDASRCVNPLHYEDVDRKEWVRKVRREYRHAMPLKDVNCRQCGKIFKAKTVGSCFDCLKNRLNNTERPCRNCGQLFKGERCDLCVRAKLKANPRTCDMCGYSWVGKGACQKCRRREVVDAYGGRCYCCGETDVGFLTLDHVKNDGHRHLAANGTRIGGNSLVRWAIHNNYPDTLQVACWNCNCARAKQASKRCPHVEKKQHAFFWRDGLSVKKRAKVARRQRAMAAYGNKCECCGESNPAFLTFDHINDDGKDHKNENGRRTSGHELVDWIIKNKYPDTIRLLCWNCNCGRAQQSDKICPHKKPLIAQAA